jgi:DNA-binding transcriptional regulator YiaG
MEDLITIKELRKRMGVTQKKLGSMFGVPTTRIKKWESIDLDKIRLTRGRYNLLESLIETHFNQD